MINMDILWAGTMAGCSVNEAGLMCVCVCLALVNFTPRAEKFLVATINAEKKEKKTQLISTELKQKAGFHPEVFIV